MTLPLPSYEAVVERPATSGTRTTRSTRHTAVLSMDLRRRIIAVWLRTESTWPELAVPLGVGVATVDWLGARYRVTDDVERTKQNYGAHPKLNDSGVEAVRWLQEERPGRTLPEMVRALAERHGLSVSASTTGQTTRERLEWIREDYRPIGARPRERSGRTRSSLSGDCVGLMVLFRVHRQNGQLYRNDACVRVATARTACRGTRAAKPRCHHDGDRRDRLSRAGRMDDRCGWYVRRGLSVFP